MMNRLLRCLFLLVVSMDQTTLAAFVPSHHQHQHSKTFQKRNVQLSLDASSADVILPSLIFLAGVAGSIVYSDETLKDKLLKKSSDEPVKTTTTTPAPAPVVVVPEPEPEPEVVVAPPPPPAVVKPPPPAPAAPSKSISDLRKEVASTVADVRATQARIQQRTAEAASPPAPEPEPEPEPAPVPPKKRSLLRQGFRVLKKVVAPWRKWENIS